MSLIKTSEEVICRCALCVGQSVFPFDGDDGVPEQSEFGIVSNKTLDTLLSCNHLKKKDLVVFVGGFLDGLFCCMLKLAKEYYKLNPQQDIWYATHDSAKQLRKIVQSYNNAGKKVVLIGHSWGGDTAAYLLRNNQDIRADLLVTFDPVSKKGAPAKTENMGKWVNIFVDYEISRNHHSNLLAKIGGPWKNAKNADINITQQEWGKLPLESDQKKMTRKELNELHHSDVYWMFFCKKLAAVWKEILPESILTCDIN